MTKAMCLDVEVPAGQPREGNRTTDRHCFASARGRTTRSPFDALTQTGTETEYGSGDQAGGTLLDIIRQVASTARNTVTPINIARTSAIACPYDALLAGVIKRAAELSGKTIATGKNV